MASQMLVADGLDSAIIGVGSRQGQPDLVVYDEDRVISLLMERDEMTYADALEFYEYNIKGAWAGDGTPIWFRRMDEGEFEAFVEENG